MEGRNTAVLLAGGSGKRMGAGDAKQFLMLDGKPVLARSLEALASSSVIDDIVLVVRAGDEERIKREVVSAVPGAEKKVRALVNGGAERYDSVFAGLLAITWPCGLVFIHDGARPFVKEETLEALARCAGEGQGAVAGCPSRDTVKIADENGFVSSTPNRRNVWIIQTPQVFERETITRAYREAISKGKELLAQGIQITDDAMVAERFAGIPIKLVDAGSENIKITEPSDLWIGEAIARGRRGVIQG